MTQYGKNTGYLLFRNPSRTQIITFSLEQKERDYLGKCGYYEYTDLSKYPYC